MRRILAMAVLGGALFTASACGGNDNNDDGNDASGGGAPTTAAGGGGTASNEEVCAEGETIAADFGTEFQAAGEELATAAATGDEAATEEAAANLTGIADDTAGELRDLAATAEDPELRTAIEDFATELEGLSDAIVADPTSLESLDTTGLDESAQRLEELCPTS